MPYFEQPDNDYMQNVYAGEDKRAGGSVLFNPPSEEYITELLNPVAQNEVEGKENAATYKGPKGDAGAEFQDIAGAGLIKAMPFDLGHKAMGYLKSIKTGKPYEEEYENAKKYTDDVLDYYGAKNTVGTAAKAAKPINDAYATLAGIKAVAAIPGVVPAVSKAASLAAPIAVGLNKVPFVGPAITKTVGSAFSTNPLKSAAGLAALGGVPTTVSEIARGKGVVPSVVSGLGTASDLAAYRLGSAYLPGWLSYPLAAGYETAKGMYNRKKEVEPILSTQNIASDISEGVVKNLLYRGLRPSEDTLVKGTKKTKAVDTYKELLGKDTDELLKETRVSGAQDTDKLLYAPTKSNKQIADRLNELDSKRASKLSGEFRQAKKVAGSKVQQTVQGKYPLVNEDPSVLEDRVDKAGQRVNEFTMKATGKGRNVISKDEVDAVLRPGTDARMVFDAQYNANSLKRFGEVQRPDGNYKVLPLADTKRELSLQSTNAGNTNPERIASSASRKLLSKGSKTFEDRWAEADDNYSKLRSTLDATTKAGTAEHAAQRTLQEISAGKPITEDASFVYRMPEQAKTNAVRYNHYNDMAELLSKGADLTEGTSLLSSTGAAAISGGRLARYNVSKNWLTSLADFAKTKQMKHQFDVIKDLRVKDLLERGKATEGNILRDSKLIRDIIKDLPKGGK